MWQFKAAIDEYESLKRELSKASRKLTGDSKLEEGGALQDDFNLDEYLHGMRDDLQQAGSKPKHLGVIWKNLVVQV